MVHYAPIKVCRRLTEKEKPMKSTNDKTFKDGWNYAYSGGKLSDIRNDKGQLEGFRDNEFRKGFRAAHIQINKEKMFSVPYRVSLKSTGWDKKK